MRASPGGTTLGTFLRQQSGALRFQYKRPPTLVSPEMQPRLWRFIATVAQDRGIKALAIGGTENHLHGLIAVPSTMPLGKAIQSLKGVSSKWMNEHHGNFAWQEGYGAFSVSSSQIDATIRYIERQAEHHRKRSFDEEFIAFLKKNNVPYDPKFVFG